MIALLGALTSGLAACGIGTANPTIGPPPNSATPAAETPAAATPAAPSAVAGGEPCSVHVGDECPMPAGEYHSTRFGGGVTLELTGAGWTNIANEPDVLSLSKGSKNWFVLVSGAVKLLAADAEPVSDPAAAQSTLAGTDGLTVTPVEGTTEIDGQAAVAFDVTNTGVETITLWYYPTTDAHYVLDPDITTRLLVIVLRSTPGERQKAARARRGQGRP